MVPRWFYFSLCFPGSQVIEILFSTEKLVQPGLRGSDRPRSGSLHVDSSLIVWRSPPARVSAQLTSPLSLGEQLTSPFLGDKLTRLELDRDLSQSPLALELCSTLLVFLSPNLSPRYSTFFSCNKMRNLSLASVLRTH